MDSVSMNEGHAMPERAARMKQIASAWVHAGAQEYVGALRKTLNSRLGQDIRTATHALNVADEPLEKINVELEDAIATSKFRHTMRGIRFGLRGSSAIIRIQSIIDRNEELYSRMNLDQAIDVNVDGIPSKIVVTKTSDVADKIICCVYRAVPTQFGRFCMKDHTDEEGNVTRRMLRHDFGLIEKHFGVHYSAVPSQRYVINASAFVNQVRA